MVAKQTQSLFAFADALGYHVLLHRNSGKPYFKAIVSMFGTCNILDITQMQYLHNMAFFEDKLDPDTRLHINLWSSGKNWLHLSVIDTKLIMQVFTNNVQRYIYYGINEIKSWY